MKCGCGRGFKTPRARSVHRAMLHHPLTLGMLLDRTKRSGECWEWTGKRAMGPHGYGVTIVDGQEVKVTRVVWRLIHGGLDPDLDLCHTCDNPPCIRPTHLFAATHAENMADMKAKGRSANARTHDPVTECIRGHAFDEANTAYDIRGCRRCRACSRARAKGLIPRRAVLRNTVRITLQVVGR